MRRPWQRKAVMLIGVATAVLLISAWFWYSHPRQRFLRAVAALEKNDFAQAASELADLKQRTDSTTYVNVLQGALSLRKGRPHEAIRFFSRTPPEGELRGTILLWTGECLVRLGRLVEAQWALQQLVEEEPQNDSAHRWLGVVYYDLGAMNAAIAELRRALELNPSEPRPHILLGAIHFDVEEYGTAVTHYRQLPPNLADSRIKRNLAIALLRLHQPQEALSILRSESKDTDGLVLQAECHLELNDQASARQVLDEARSLDPKSRAVLVLSARLLLLANHPGEAIPVLRQVVESDPHDYQSRYQLALACRDLGQMDDYESEMAQYESSRKLHMRYLELSRQARLNPNDVQVRDELAELAKQLGKLEVAAMWKRSVAAFQLEPTTSLSKGQAVQGPSNDPPH